MIGSSGHRERGGRNDIIFLTRASCYRLHLGRPQASLLSSPPKLPYRQSDLKLDLSRGIDQRPFPRHSPASNSAEIAVAT
jgi:hypothetical protein